MTSRLSGRGRQLLGDLCHCLMSTDTMSAATFAPAAPSEDGVWPEEEISFKIAAARPACPPHFRAREALGGSRHSTSVFLLSGAKPGQVGLARWSGHWDQGTHSV